MLEKTLESPLDYKIKPVNPKGNQPWVFTGRTYAEVEAATLWPVDVKSSLNDKDLMLGKIEDRRRRGWDRVRWLDGITNSMTWVWVSSRSLWWTGKPGMLQSMGSQRIRHNWVTELNWSLKRSKIHAMPSYAQSLRRARLLMTPWTAAHQASLSITNTQSLLTLMPIESVMPSSHLIPCCPLLFLPPIPSSIRVFSSESTLHMRWPKY